MNESFSSQQEGEHCEIFKLKITQKIYLIQILRRLSLLKWDFTLFDLKV